MKHQPLSSDLFDRYLRILGLARKEPAYAALTELVTAQLTRVPFENISKLYYRNHEDARGLPGLEKYLNGIDRYNFGGTCYTNNYYLNLLLKYSGYAVKLCGADMDNPDVHIVNLVTVEGREYLVDGGYGAPFLEPIPRDLAVDYEIVCGRERFVVKPQDADGRSAVELYLDGQLKHGYLAKPMARQIEFFEDVIVHSFTDEAMFMNAVVLIRFWPGRSTAIRNLTIIESEGAVWRKRRLDDREDLPQAVAEHFGIPRTIVAEAIAGLDNLGDAWI